MFATLKNADAAGGTADQLPEGDIMTNHETIKPLTPKQQVRCNVKGCAANGLHDLEIDTHVAPHLPWPDYKAAMEKDLEQISMAYDARHSTTEARIRRIVETLRGLGRRERNYICEAARARAAGLEGR
jgi:hypothetical protein